MRVTETTSNPSTLSIKEQGVHSGIRVIGLGNEYRNDDAVGPLVARKLSKVCEGLFSVLELSGEGTQLMEGWEGADAVFLVDATSAGRKTGHVCRIDAWNAKLEPSAFRHSTHAFGIAESIELAKVIGGLPKTCVVFGIEGEDFGSGTNISHPVMQAADKVIEAIVAEVHSMLRSKVPGP